MPYQTNHLRILLFGITVLVFQNLGHAAWVQMAPFGGEARHRCTGFSVGNKGYIGGGHTNSGALAYFKDYWEYDPGTNSWTQIADFGGGYRYHSAAFSIGSYGYAGLGENELGAYTSDFWKYIPLINTWVQVAAMPGEPRRGAAAFVIGDKGYVGTGQTEAGYTTDFYVYDPVTNAWDTIAPFSGEARSSAVAFSNSGKGYVGTGHVFGDDRNDFFEYDPITDTWTQKADVGPLARQDATGFVLNGEGYIGTGNDNEGTDNFDDFWKYDFDTDTWIEIAEFDGLARRYLVSFVIGNTAYCGTGTNGTNLRDFWAFYPLVGISETEADMHFVYPNPATDFVVAGNFSNATCDRFMLADISGKIILDETMYSGKQIPLTHFSNGTYVYFLLEKNNLIHSGKLQINR